MTCVAAVSYLNARPLIDGLDLEPGFELVRQVPSRLLETLESGTAEIALCPVIDFQVSGAELAIVPSGAIGCDGPALTVKLFSRRPFAELKEIAVDGDSHTSAALLAVIMARVFDRRPNLRPLAATPGSRRPEALLLIGDKVVTNPPDDGRYPFQLDLGAAWKDLAGSPFVFATWMTPVGCDLGDLPNLLNRIRHANRDRLRDIATRHAASGGWPEELAIRYLTRNLRYTLGPAELAGMEAFWRLCREEGIIETARPLRLYRS